MDYIYDVENRWIGENICGNGVEHETRFAYDGNQIVLEFDRGLSKFRPTKLGLSPLAWPTSATAISGNQTPWIS